MLFVVPFIFSVNNWSDYYVLSPFFLSILRAHSFLGRFLLGGLPNPFAWPSWISYRLPVIKVYFSSSSSLVKNRSFSVWLVSSNAKGEWYALSAGGSFTPHVIIVGTGEVRLVSHLIAASCSSAASLALLDYLAVLVLRRWGCHWAFLSNSLVGCGGAHNVVFSEGSTLGLHPLCQWDNI